MNTRYTFYPRPEAHPMNWDELLPPLRRAVRDLLLRLDGAVAKVNQSLHGSGKDSGGEVTANCFLVYGERGTGKSTVLLSAKAALCDTEKFFSKIEASSTGGQESAFHEDARISAKSLSEYGAVWLEVLDLEPLPPHANMLTIMLTRVREAIYHHDCERESESHLSSIIEEDAESSRHQLTRLINDATLMWEDIDEVDTRNRANRQVAAADIFTPSKRPYLPGRSYS